MCLSDVDSSSLDGLCANLREHGAHRAKWKFARRIAWLTFADGGLTLDQKRVSRRNTSGVTGVRWRPTINSWQAVIVVQGKLRSLGCFKEKGAAIAARKAAERQHYGITS